MAADRNNEKVSYLYKPSHPAVLRLISETVLAAKDKKAQTEALVSLMKNKLSILRQAHDDLKKILYGDQNMTGYEGM